MSTISNQDAIKILNLSLNPDQTNKDLAISLINSLKWWDGIKFISFIQRENISKETIYHWIVNISNDTNLSLEQRESLGIDILRIYSESYYPQYTFKEFVDFELHRIVSIEPTILDGLKLESIDEFFEFVDIIKNCVDNRKVPARHIINYIADRHDFLRIDTYLNSTQNYSMVDENIWVLQMCLNSHHYGHSYNIQKQIKYSEEYQKWVIANYDFWFDYNPKDKACFFFFVFGETAITLSSEYCVIEFKNQTIYLDSGTLKTTISHIIISKTNDDEYYFAAEVNGGYQYICEPLIKALSLRKNSFDSKTLNPLIKLIKSKDCAHSIETNQSIGAKGKAPLISLDNDREYIQTIRIINGKFLVESLDEINNQQNN